jgi:hypothetical protein
VQRTLFVFAFALSSASTLAAQAKPATAQKPTAEKPVWPDEGPRKWAPRPTESAITANDLRTRLYQFADDSMAGRRIGELGNWKGTEYIAREFKRLGLKPAGDNGGYFQNLSYGPTSIDSTKARLMVAGAALVQKTDWIPVLSAANSGLGVAVDVNAVSAVYAGQWNDSSTVLDPAVFRGKVAVFAGGPPGGGGGAGGGRGAPQRCDSLPDRFGARMAAYSDSVTAAGRGGRGGRGGGGGRGGPGGRGAAPANTGADPRVASAGIVAVLFVGLDAATAATLNGAFITRGSMELAAFGRNAPGVANISTAAAQKLFGKPLDELTVGTVGQPITASWTFQWKMSDTPARNVVAVLPGSNPALAGEYVLVGAHNDHVGTLAAGIDHDSTRAVNWVTRRQGSNDPVCRPTADQQHLIDSLIARARGIRPARRDSIMNGADDDGSGTVVLLEIAEKFASEKPARSIIFVSHQGEESGLLGSKWFVDHPTIPLGQIVAAHNMDMVGKGRVDYVKFGGPSSVQTLGSRRQSREFGDIIDSVNAQRAETMAIDKTWDAFENPMNRFCRSDQVNYVSKNVPVTYFSTGYAPDYHIATDEPQYIEYDHSARVGRFIHDVMWAIAMRKDRPAIAGADPRYPSCGR